MQKYMKETESHLEANRVGHLLALSSLPERFLRHYLHRRLPSVAAQALHSNPVQLTLFDTLLEATKIHYTTASPATAATLGSPESQTQSAPTAKFEQCTIKKPQLQPPPAASATTKQSESSASVDRDFAESRTGALKALALVARRVGNCTFLQLQSPAPNMPAHAAHIISTPAPNDTKSGATPNTYNAINIPIPTGGQSMVDTLYEALFAALEDYTKTNRGDIARRYISLRFPK